MARWALISGPRRSDASSQALELSSLLKARGYRVGGFIQLRRKDESGCKHIDLYHLRTGLRASLASETLVTSETDTVSFCSFSFRPEAFDQALGWLVEDAEQADILFVGDLSKVEVTGSGNHRAATYVLERGPRAITIFCVRADQLFNVVEKYSLEDDALAALELPAEVNECQRFREDILRALLDGQIPTADTRKMGDHESRRE